MVIWNTYSTINRPNTIGKGYVYKVEIIEKYNGNKIEDTIVLTILNSPVYTLNMNKFAKNSLILILVKIPPYYVPTYILNN